MEEPETSHLEGAGSDDNTRDINDDGYMDDIPEYPGQIIFGEDHGGDEIDENVDIGQLEEFTPVMGMTFKTVDEAYDFYNKYAYIVGFGITRQHARRRDGKQYEFTFTCAKAGRVQVRPDYKYKRRKKSKKTNCLVKMTIRDHVDGLFHVSNVVLVHNHLCTPGKVQLHRSHKFLPPGVKKQLDVGDRASLTPNESFQPYTLGGNGKDAPLPERNCMNYDPRIGILNPEEGDLQAVLDYFHHMHKENPRFFYMMDMNDEGQLRNVFWASAKSRLSYTYFYDVIYFDTTSLRNKSLMPLTTFLGVDHHGYLVLLGAALLSGMRTDTFVWLFKTWLACMDNLAPKAIITDQFKEVEDAVAEVFPNSCHRLCLQQILEMVPKKVATNSKCKEIMARLDDVVYDSLREREFEAKWDGMILEYGLEKNEWLKSLYAGRRKWVPAFVKKTFWAGMSSLRRLERVEPYFGKSVILRTSLRDFFKNYENALKGKHDKETIVDFDSCGKQLPLVSRLMVERHLSTLYTASMFEKFQNELIKCMDCTILLTATDGPISKFRVCEDVHDKMFTYEVVFVEEEMKVQCICCLFEFSGILCAHAIMVLKEMRMNSIPTRYICNRWLKSFKCNSHICPPSIYIVPGLPLERYDKLYSMCLQLIPNMVETCRMSTERYDFLLKLLTEAQVKLKEYDSKNGVEATDCGTFVAHQVIVDGEDVDGIELSGGPIERRKRLSADEDNLYAQKKKHMSKGNLSQSMHVTPPPYFPNLSYPASGVGSQANAVFPPITKFYGHNEGGVMPAMLYGSVFTQLSQVQPPESGQLYTVCQQTHPPEVHLPYLPPNPSTFNN